MKLPDELMRSFCGVGNPFVDGPIETGSAVLDVGCGSGVDLIIAGRHTGDTGRVCGIDLTPEMASLARENATIAGLAPVEIRDAPAESIPYGDGTFDVVISNAVLNLSTDKERAFREIFRVLRPDGRLQVADIVLEGDRPREAPLTIDAWSDWIGGALPVRELLEIMQQAGFENPAFLGRTIVSTSPRTHGALFQARKPR